MPWGLGYVSSWRHRRVITLLCLVLTDPCRRRRCFGLLRIRGQRAAAWVCEHERVQARLQGGSLDFLLRSSKTRGGKPAPHRRGGTKKQEQEGKHGGRVAAATDDVEQPPLLPPAASRQRHEPRQEDERRKFCY